jgi:hypothetical protein
VIEDLDLSGVKQLTDAHLSNVTFTRVVFKGSKLQVCLRWLGARLLLPHLLRPQLLSRM